MKIMLIAAGEPDFAWEDAYTSEGFAAACRAAAESPVRAVSHKPLQAAGREILCGTELYVRQTAATLFPETEIVPEGLLDEVPLGPYKDRSQKLPLKRWRRMALLQARGKNGREHRRQARERAERMIEQLEKQGQDCVLVSGPLFMGELMERFRARGWCVSRSGIFRVKPLELALVTRRDDHCGGCGHNCLLTNPGCGVGRDKAQRLNRYKS